MKYATLTLFDIASVRYERMNYAASTTPPVTGPFVVHRLYLIDKHGVSLEINLHAPGDISFIDFPTASEGPVEVAGTGCEPGMAPAPEVVPPVAGGPSNELPELDDAGAEKLAEHLRVYQRLADMPAKELVDVALEMLDLAPNNTFEQVIEELCSRVHPNWPNEIPPESQP